MIAPIRPPLIKSRRSDREDSPLTRARKAVANSLLPDFPRFRERQTWRGFWVFSGWLLLVTAAVIALWLR